MTMVPFDPAKPATNDLRNSSPVRNNFNGLFNGDFAPLRARAQATPNMTLQVAGCDVEAFWRQVWIGGLVPFNYAGGSSPNIVAPSTNPRIALLVINAVGTLAWIYGSEATSPVPPDNLGGNIPICWVYEKTTMTKIVNFEDAGSNPNEAYIYRDVRPFFGLGGSDSTGDIIMTALRTARFGFLMCNGAPQSRTTYAYLFSLIVPNLGTVTITIANPAVCTCNNHGLAAGDPVFFTTTGSLPAPISPNTIYYVMSAGLTTNAFQISATPGGAAISTVGGTQSGTHTLYFCPFGLGDGATTFNVPNLNGRVAVGKSADTEFNVLGKTGGAKTHTLTVAEMPAHVHDTTIRVAGSAAPPGVSLGNGSYINTGSTGGGAAHNNIQPYQVLNYMIKY